MKEIIEAMSMRIKSPIFGYFIFSFIAINWKPLFFLLIEKATVNDRIVFFESNTDIGTLLFIPLFFASIGAVFYPWVNYSFLWITRKPTELRNSIQVKSEHTVLIEKQKLEETRNQLLQQEENALINRAKRDEEISTIEDQDIRTSLQEQIDELRNSDNSLTTSSLSGASKDLHAQYLEQAVKYK